MLIVELTVVASVSPSIATIAKLLLFRLVVPACTAAQLVAPDGPVICELPQMSILSLVVDRDPWSKRSSDHSLGRCQRDSKGQDQQQRARNDAAIVADGSWPEGGACASHGRPYHCCRRASFKVEA